MSNAAAPFTDEELSRYRAEVSAWIEAGRPSRWSFSESERTMMDEVERWLAAVEKQTPSMPVARLTEESRRELLAITHPGRVDGPASQDGPGGHVFQLRARIAQLEADLAVYRAAASPVGWGDKEQEAREGAFYREADK